MQRQRKTSSSDDDPRATKLARTDASLSLHHDHPSASASSSTSIVPAPFGTGLQNDGDAPTSTGSSSATALDLPVSPTAAASDLGEPRAGADADKDTDPDDGWESASSESSGTGSVSDENDEPNDRPDNDHDGEDGWESASDAGSGGNASDTADKDDDGDDSVELLPSLPRILDAVDHVLTANVPMFASLPANLQGAMLHYLIRHMAARFVVETTLAMHQYTLTETPHLLFNLIAEIMQEEGRDLFDASDVLEFAMHALRTAITFPDVYGTDWMPDDDDDDGDEGSGSEEEGEESEESVEASEESEDESDDGTATPDGWVNELRPDPTLHDLGGDLDWYRSITSKEYFSSIRGLHSMRFVTRSPRWPIKFAVPSSTIHFQCANSLALGPLLPPFGGLVLQQPYTVRCDKIFTRTDPDWYSPRCQNRKGHACLVTLDDCPLSIAAQHGYLMTGSEGGDLIFFCNQPPAVYSEIDGDSVPSLEMIALRDADDMYNSAQIIDGPYGGGYFGIAALNEGIVEIYPLAAHDVPNATVRTHVSPASAVRPTWVVNFPGCVNDAKFSPDRHWLACVGDHGAVWLTRVQWVAPLADGRVPSPKLGTPVCADLTNPVLLAVALHDAPAIHRRLDAAAAMRDLLARVTSQYVAWAPCATRFALSCDTVPYVLVFALNSSDSDADAVARLEHVIGTAQPTYAIAFHPHDRSVLAVSNRHGFVQVIDVEGHEPLKLPEVPKGCTLEDAAVKWDKETLTVLAASAKRYLRDVIQVTDGCKTSCLINGLQWTLDGRYLYIATNQRVLVYQFNRVPPLFDLVAQKLSLIGTESKAMPIMCYNRFQEATVGMQAMFRH